MGARAALALGCDMAVNGAITGAVDSGTRYLAGDTENKNLDGFVKEVKSGAIGGFIMAPIIGGGMRLAAKGACKFGNVLKKGIESGQRASLSDFAPIDDSLTSMFTIDDRRLGAFTENITPEDAERFFRKLDSSISFDESGFFRKAASAIDLSDFTPDEALAIRNIIGGSNNLSELFQNLGDNKLFVKVLNSMDPQDIQRLIESGGVGTTKIAQILSNKESFMDKIKDYPNNSDSIKAKCISLLIDLQKSENGARSIDLFWKQNASRLNLEYSGNFC